MILSIFSLTIFYGGTFIVTSSLILDIFRYGMTEDRRWLVFAMIKVLALVGWIPLTLSLSVTLFLVGISLIVFSGIPFFIYRRRLDTDFRKIIPSRAQRAIAIGVAAAIPLLILIIVYALAAWKIGSWTI